MALFQSKQIAAKKQCITPDGDGDAMAYLAEFVVPTGLANGDIIEMAGLPAGNVPTGMKLACAAMDSNGTPTIVFNIGYLSGNYGVADATRTCGAEFVSASVVGKLGGIQNESVATALLATPTLNDRGVGLVLTTGAATLVVGAKLRMTLSYVPTTYGIDAA